MSGKPRGPRNFRDRDIKRIVRAVADTTRQPIKTVAVDPKTGHCVVTVGESDDATVASANTWDEVHAANEKRPA